MKQSDREREQEPSWYKSLKVDPLTTPTFTARLAADIRHKALQRGRRKSSKTISIWTAAIMLSIVLLLLPGERYEAVMSWLGIESQASIKTPEQITDPINKERSAELNYYPQLSEPLLLLKAKPASKPIKSISLNVQENQPPVVVHLYEDSKQPKLITAFLEENGLWYNIGEVSSQGAELVSVTVESWANGEIRIIGPLAEQVMQIVYYNESLKQWELIDFQKHRTEAIDLDGDGRDELVSAEVNTVPPMVTIHRWNEASNKAESALVDVTAGQLFNMDWETTITRSYLFKENGKWYIELGSGDEWHTFLRYEKGALIEAQLMDNESRLLKLQQQSQQHH